MKGKTLYQTLEDRGKPEYILATAPFPCKWENAWLGEGYYFWDTFIENAHWWGDVRYRNAYVISEMICDFDSSLCFDLVGDTEHMLDFSRSIDFMKSENLVDKNTTVSRILNLLKYKVGGFDFQAIRVYGNKSISGYKEEYRKYRHHLKFELSKPQYLDYKPAIQLCIFEKTGLNLRDLSIVYPDKYNKESVV